MLKYLVRGNLHSYFALMLHSPLSATPGCTEVRDEIGFALAEGTALIAFNSAARDERSEQLTALAASKIAADCSPPLRWRCVLKFDAAQRMIVITDE